MKLISTTYTCRTPWLNPSICIWVFDSILALICDSFDRTSVAIISKHRDLEEQVQDASM